jgi:hypothetical protein
MRARQRPSCWACTRPSELLDRIQRSKSVPGFADHPDHFLIDPYTIDKDQWVDGYIEVG